MGAADLDAHRAGPLPRIVSGVLVGSACLPVLHIPFDYVSLAELGSVAGTLAVGAGLAWAYLRRREPRVINGLRAIHTGSANDYAGHAVAGKLAVIAILGLT
jgi:multicomponent Na+:H+ antiporter subunit D